MPRVTKQATIEAQAQEIEALQAELAQAKKAQAQEAEYIKALAKLDLEKKELEAKLGFLKQDLAFETEERLKEREARRKAEAQAKLARNDLEAYKAFCREAEAKLDQVEIELDQARASRSVACKRIEALQAQLARAEKVIELQEAEAELATFRQVELEGKLDWKERCLTSQGLEHAKQVSGLQARLEQAEARERGLRLDLQGMVQAQEELKSKHKQELAIQASFKKLAQELASDQEEIEQAQAIAFLRQENKKLQEQAEALQTNNRKLQEDIRFIVARADEYTFNLQGKFEARFIGQAKSIKELREKLEQAELDARRASDWMNDKLIEAQAEASFAQEALEEKVQELQALQARLDRAQEKLASQAQELDVNGIQ